MTAVYTPLKLECPRATLEVIHKLQKAGFQAVLAGGCVRDALRGVQPHDWDIATSAHPDEVEAIFDRTIPVGKQFGIIIAVIDGEPFEIATFRGESTYSDGRHPDEVRFVQMDEDVQRRDFTVNALLYDPVNSMLYDFVGGQADLNARILRAVGDPARRFSEDRLRILRAVRFAAQLDFEIDEATWAALAPAAPMLTSCVSPERICSELEKMLLSGHARRAFDMLERAEILKVIAPVLAAEKGVEQPPEFHPEGDVWQHELKLLAAMDEIVRNRACDTGPLDDNALKTLTWAALLHDIGKPSTFFRAKDRIRFNGHDVIGAEMTEEFLKHLRLPNALIADVTALVRQHMSLTQFPAARVATRRRKMQDPLFPLLLELTRLDTIASFGQMELYQYCLSEYQEELARPKPPKPTLTGRDLLDAGLKPGPIFKVILDAAMEHELVTPFTNRDEALEWLRTFCKTV